MSGTVHNFPERQPEQPAPSAAPPLPIEGQIVAVALAVERMKQLAQQMLLLCQYAPRAADDFNRTHRDILDAWCQADRSYTAYQALLDCEGQA